MFSIGEMTSSEKCVQAAITGEKRKRDVEETEIMQHAQQEPTCTSPTSNIDANTNTDDGSVALYTAMEKRNSDLAIPTSKNWRGDLPASCEIATLQKWLDVGGTTTSLPLVDLRTNEQYSKRRISINQKKKKSSIIVNLPFETLLSGERSCELPPRTVPFAILVPASYCDNGILSKTHNIHVIFDLFFATVSKATGQSRTPWLVQQILCECSDIDDTSSACSCIWDDARSMNVLDDTSIEPGVTVAPRLWKPDPLVHDTLLPLLKERLKAWSIEMNGTKKSGTKQQQQQIMGEVWDMGSGAGRDLCFLAEELQHYHRHELKMSGDIRLPILFVGIDNHKGSAKRCVPLWKHRGVGDITKSVLMNLKKLDSVQDAMAKTNVILSYAVRYLNRPLMNFLASNCEENALFALSHFCRKEDGLWNFDHPKINSVLEYGEIKRLFCGTCSSGGKERYGTKCGDWEVLENKLCSDADFGRTMVNFVSCRRVMVREDIKIK